MKILICDKNPILTKLRKKELELHGHEVLTAYDGIEGVEILKKERPDVLILDILIDLVNGYQFIKIARMENENLVIIIATNINSQNFLEQLYRLGVNDIIIRPSDPEKLDRRIQSVIIQM